MVKKFRRAVLALMIGFALTFAGLPTATAAKTITISGTVACQDGAKVTGLWVHSSTGGSGWAKWTARSGAAWIADYSYNIVTTKSSTAAELHLGCGGTTSKWGSNTKRKLGTLSASTSASMICVNKSGKTAYACRNWAKSQVLIGMPFTGRAGGDATSHAIVGTQQVAEDLYAPPGTAAKAYAYAPKGVKVTLTKSTFGKDTCGGVNIDIKADGVKVGRVTYGHLAPSSGTGTVSNGTTIGTTKKWPYKTFDGTCGWLVTNNSGVHTHVGMTSHTGKACFTWYTSLNRGEWIGSVGKTSATKNKQFCAM